MGGREREGEQKGVGRGFGPDPGSRPRRLLEFHLGLQVGSRRAKKLVPMGALPVVTAAVHRDILQSTLTPRHTCIWRSALDKTRFCICARVCRFAGQGLSGSTWRNLALLPTGRQGFLLPAELGRGCNGVLEI